MISMSFQFDSMADFFAMSGHGIYVWAAYGITALVLAVLAFRPLLKQRRFLSIQRMQNRVPNDNGNSNNIEDSIKDDLGNGTAK